MQRAWNVPSESAGAAEGPGRGAHAGAAPGESAASAVRLSSRALEVAVAAVQSTTGETVP